MKNGDVESERTVTALWASTSRMTKSQSSVDIHQRGHSRRKRGKSRVAHRLEINPEKIDPQIEKAYTSFTITSLECDWFIYSSCSMLHIEFYNLV